MNKRGFSGYKRSKSEQNRFYKKKKRTVFWKSDCFSISSTIKFQDVVNSRNASKLDSLVNLSPFQNNLEIRSWHKIIFGNYKSMDYGFSNNHQALMIWILFQGCLRQYPKKGQHKKRRFSLIKLNHLLWWRRWDSNPLPLGCQPSALAK